MQTASKLTIHRQQHNALTVSTTAAMKSTNKAEMNLSTKR